MENLGRAIKRQLAKAGIALDPVLVEALRSRATAASFDGKKYWAVRLHPCCAEPLQSRARPGAYMAISEFIETRASEHGPDWWRWFQG
ncbi:MAG: hypothetical protein KBE04_12735 [Phycisphaerae bacterium]|nr:hypothetical protein [Phycisphaerae bacterium]